MLSTRIKPVKAKIAKRGPKYCTTKAALIPMTFKKLKFMTAKVFFVSP